MKIKSKIYLLIFFISLQSCSQKTNEKSDLEKLKLNGKIKSITVNTYLAIKKFGVLVKQDITNDTLGLEQNHITIYNEKGFLIEEKNAISDYKSIFSYNEINQLIEEKQFDNNDVLIKRVSKLYDEKGNNIELKIFYGDELLSIDKFIYDKDGNEVERKNFDAKNKLACMITHKFDNNNCIEEICYKSDGEVQFSYKSIFDKSRNNIETAYYDSFGNLTSKSLMFYNGNLMIGFSDTTIDNIVHKEKYFYKFDSKKNWIEKINYSNGKPKTIIQRKIQYY